jgi:predicted phage terminase large subunit-like protein
MKRAVGSYAWAALFQQRPAPEQGAIFNVGWWRYWTLNPALATEDGRVVYLDPPSMIGARWLDSYDAAFKGTDDSDYVVGQRWMRHGGNRYLIDQIRGRWSFTQTIARMRDWLDGGLFPEKVHERLIEDKANGPAIIDTLHDQIAGLKPINPRTSKEARARSVTPEIESGNVYLPLPSEAPWVLDLLSELRSFPSGANDDQVDALTQALTELREGAGHTNISVPGDRLAPALARVQDRARTGIRRSAGG